MTSGMPGEVQSVKRALRLLRQFTPQEPVWAVGELSRATQLHKSVVTRLMATMASEGFVRPTSVRSRSTLSGPKPLPSAASLNRFT